MKPLAQVFRSSLHADVLDALDQTEALYRGLEKHTAPQLGLGPVELNELSHLLETAYEALARARVITDA